MSHSKPQQVDPVDSSLPVHNETGPDTEADQDAIQGEADDDGGNNGGIASPEPSASAPPANTSVEKTKKKTKKKTEKKGPVAGDFVPGGDIEDPKSWHGLGGDLGKVIRRNDRRLEDGLSVRLTDLLLELGISKSSLPLLYDSLVCNGCHRLSYSNLVKSLHQPLRSAEKRGEIPARREAACGKPNTQPAKGNYKYSWEQNTPTPGVLGGLNDAFFRFGGYDCATDLSALRCKLFKLLSRRFAAHGDGFVVYKESKFTTTKRYEELQNNTLGKKESEGDSDGKDGDDEESEESDVELSEDGSDLPTNDLPIHKDGLPDLPGTEEERNRTGAEQPDDETVCPASSSKDTVDQSSAVDEGPAAKRQKL
jgi:hypothetical protein